MSVEEETAPSLLSLKDLLVANILKQEDSVQEGFGLENSMGLAIMQQEVLVQAGPVVVTVLEHRD